MFTNDSKSEDLDQFFNKKESRTVHQRGNGRGRGNGGTKQNPKRNFVVLSKLTKSMVYVCVAINAAASSVLYYNLKDGFAGSDPAQLLLAVPVVVGIIVCLLMVNTSSEDNQG